MTETDAINRMLRYIGELPVPTTQSIDDLPEGHEAVQARTILSETVREEQESKWWFNAITQTFTPSSDRILLPPNVILVEGLEYFVEGNQLYRRADNDGFFDTSIELDIRIEVDFSDLPDVFRTYVVLVAAKHLHVYLNGDETTQKELDNKVNLQRIKVEREHLKQSKFNLIKGSRLIDRGTNPTALI